MFTPLRGQLFWPGPLGQVEPVVVVVVAIEVVCQSQGGQGSPAISKEPEKSPRRCLPKVMDPENRITCSLRDSI
jgi:hypothetical protein